MKEQITIRQIGLKLLDAFVGLFIGLFTGCRGMLMILPVLIPLFIIGLAVCLIFCKDQTLTVIEMIKTFLNNL